MTRQQSTSPWQAQSVQQPLWGTIQQPIQRFAGQSQSFGQPGDPVQQAVQAAQQAEQAAISAQVAAQQASVGPQSTQQSGGMFAQQPSEFQGTLASQGMGGQQLQQPVAFPQAQPLTQPMPQGGFGGSREQVEQIAQPGVQQPVGQPQSQQLGQPQRQEVGGYPREQVQQAGQQSLEPSMSPFVDVYDASDSITVIADIPGVLNDDIRLEGDERTLHIIAETEIDDDLEELTPIQKERLRRIERTIELPTAVNVEEAEAVCENGVCKVTLPKEEQYTIGVQ